ncbi:MAG: prolipoprotein diacylglyceryl transferase [Saprospiraceae bacterium]|nr:prolipoprotein diacylglyceryl transferase [Saprospiraceae bacterium]
MYPDLSYLFHDLIGTQPDNWLSIFKTFGFFLALAFLVSALVFSIELKRKAREGVYQPTIMTITEGLPASMGDLLGNAFVGLLMGGKGLYAYPHFTDFRQDPASIVLSAKMHWPAAIIGAVLLAAFTWWEANRRRKNPPVVRQVNVFPHHRISEMTVAAAVGGITGAKLFDIFDNWESFVADPIGSLTSGGGLAFLGGLILGFVTVVWYMYRHGIPFLPSADAVAPALTAGYGFGRIGCQLSGDGDWGIVNVASKPGWMSVLPDWMWAYRYPHHVLNTPHTDPVMSTAIDGCNWDYCMQLSEPVYPTPFYEIMMMLGVFGILWMLRKRIRIHGVLFFIYLCLIAVERFAIEKIRVNVPHQVLGMTLTQAEIISIVLFLIGVAGALWLWKRDQNKV